MNMIGAILVVSASLLNSGHAQTSKALFLTPSASDESADEAQIKAWMKQQKKIQKKLSVASKAVKTDAADSGMNDLKDALGAKPDVSTLPKKIAQANTAERRALLERLPGMEIPPFESCRTIENCPEAPALLHVENPALVEDTVAAIVRPWILLQKAKGKEFGVLAAPGSGEQVMKLQLEGLEDAGLSVYVSPVAFGGVNVWLKGRQDPGGLYSAERHAVLAAMASAN